MVKKIVVGAHYGLKDWIGQRFTAVYMALYIAAFLVLLASQPTLDFETWRGLFGSEVLRIFTFLFIISLLFHAWVGMRDLWMDYVKPTGLILLLHILTLFALVGYAGWALSILWRL